MRKNKMQTEILYQLEESIIEYDPSVPCIIGRHIGFHMSNEFRQFLDKGLELMVEKMKEHGKVAWVANLHQSDVIIEEDNIWAAEDWTPRALKAGICHTAFVLHEDEYALANMNQEVYQDQIAKNQNEMIIGRFKDEESAKAWLREMLK
ncbi:hypothetical protein JMN32_15420 [Fulvivirga sp. 29W222]|uniref:STAS/SEC14 domain-containing protein n=1 Tax=Fulvivirga marina TaxID=2494733 RepID=A0A937KCN2_9BACT|nr:hypothetical protein [Fulvivirga marina]MBL6447707.1 hypothetical protein [Fulvivirga marina]